MFCCSYLLTNTHANRRRRPQTPQLCLDEHSVASHFSSHSFLKSTFFIVCCVSHLTHTGNTIRNTHFVFYVSIMTLAGAAEAGAHMKASSPVLPPSRYSSASHWLYEIFISILIVFFHSLSSEVNAVMSHYSINHAAALLQFTEGTSIPSHFCLDPHRVCSELLIAFMSLTSSWSLPGTGPLAWHVKRNNTALIGFPAYIAQSLCCAARKLIN